MAQESGQGGKQGVVVVVVKNCNKSQNTPMWHVYMLAQGQAAMFCSLAKQFFRLGHNQRVYAAGDHVGL
jgi:hypothetical protein